MVSVGARVVRSILGNQAMVIPVAGTSLHHPDRSQEFASVAQSRNTKGGQMEIDDARLQLYDTACGWSRG